MRIAVLQTSPRPFYDPETVEQAFAFLRQAREGGAQVAVLPEVWPTSFGADPPPQEKPWNDLLERWQEEVRRLGLVAMGGFYRFTDQGWVNALLVIDPEGELVAEYHKIHRFSFAGEEKRVEAGSQVVVWEWEGWRFGLTICYDLRFPELYRALRAQGMDVGVVVAQWPEERAEHFSLLLRARAVENLAYMVGVNRVGTDAKGRIRFSGGSSIIHPWGDPLWVCGDRPQVAFCELKREEVETYRQKYRFWEDRRQDLFGEVVAGKDV